jgi:hypothetical protein
MSGMHQSSPGSGFPKGGSAALSSSCVLMKQDHKLNAKPVERIVSCVDSQSMHTDTFKFSNRVFTESEDFNMTAYSTMIAPLVKKASQGHNTLAIFAGQGSLDFNDYLLSKMSTRGILSQATSQLLNTISIPPGNNGKKDGSVTLSWYKIDTDDNETITDVLKAASAGDQGDNNNGQKDNDNNSDDEMFLRELDSGRGTSVPGLWEVELSTGSDVDAVISHVQKISSSANHSNGQSHTCIQLAITSEKTIHGTRGINNRHDLAGMGKITFLLLSNINDNNLLPNWGLLNEHQQQQQQQQQRYNWVNSVGQLLQWIEAKHASGNLKSEMNAPYQKCKISLMLRDVVRAKQDGSILLMLKPNSSNNSNNNEIVDQSLRVCHQWLQFVESIIISSNYCLSANKSSGIGTPSTQGHGKNVIAPSTNLSAQLRAESPYKERGGKDTKTSSFKSNTPSAGNYDYTHPERRNISNKYNDNGAPIATASPSRERSTPSSKPHSLMPTPVLSGSTHYQSGAANSSRYHSPSTKNMNKNQASSTPRNSNGNGNANTNAETNTGITQNINTVIEKSRTEIASLTKALSLKSEQLLQSQLAYDVLVKQLHEDGSTLKARDRERFKAVISELKDYEIYREVMETALARMQTEVDKLQSDNDIQCKRIKELENTSRRRDDFKDQYSKDLTSTRRQLAEAYETINNNEISYKKLAKEKEDMRVLQVALKSDRMKLVKDLDTTTLHVTTLKKRITLIENKENGTSIELNNQKKSNEQLMDRLMTCQEENELLKAALTEMLEQAAVEQVLPPTPPEQEEEFEMEYDESQQSAAPTEELALIESDEDEAIPEPKTQTEPVVAVIEEKKPVEKEDKKGSMNRRRDLLKTAPASLQNTAAAAEEQKDTGNASTSTTSTKSSTIGKKTPAKSAFNRRQALLKGQ